MGTIRLYYPEAFNNLIKKLKKIAKREGRSVSQLFVKDFAVHYVRIHEKGNPQTRLDVDYSKEKWKPDCPHFLHSNTKTVYCKKINMWIKTAKCKACYLTRNL